MSLPWTINRSIAACVSGPRLSSSRIRAASARVGSMLAASAGPAELCPAYIDPTANGPTEKVPAPNKRSHFSRNVRMPMRRSSTDRTAVNGNRSPVQEVSSNNSMQTKTKENPINPIELRFARLHQKKFPSKGGDISCVTSTVKDKKFGYLVFFS
jgi:hypothetical protein